MRRYAHLYLGKIIYIVTSALSLKNICDIYGTSESMWIDITDYKAEVGYQIAYSTNGEISFVPPTYTALSVKDKIEQKKSLVNQLVEDTITSGFTMNYNNSIVYFDSDIETQITLNNIFSLSEELFNSTYPSGYSIRGRLEGRTEKIIFLMKYEDIQNLKIALMNHIMDCKVKGWSLKNKLDNCASDEEVDAIKIVLE